MRYTQKVLAVLALIILALSTTAAALAQSDSAYIQINNGPQIDVTGTEQPFIVVQLGNRGQQTLEDVVVFCQWDGLIRFAGQTQNGPFGEPELVIGDGRASLVWPQAVDLPPGQNYNVGFNIRFADTDFNGEAGTITCFLSNRGESIVVEAETVVVLRGGSQDDGADNGADLEDLIYIQINNGSQISVTGTEQPFIVVQLGNRSQQTVEDLKVICGWSGLIRFAGQTQNGPFGEPELVFIDGVAALAWPVAVDLRPGQNYNVGFNIRFALPDPNFKGDAGVIECALGPDLNNSVFSNDLDVIIR